MDTFNRYSFLLDNHFRILKYDQSFPSSYCAVPLSPVEWVGKPYLSCIDGEPIKQWVASQLQRVSMLDQSVSLDYRCDDAEFKRWCQMKIHKQQDNLILVEHHTLKAEPVEQDQQHRAYNDQLPKVQRCSLCCKYLFNGHWLEIEDFKVVSAQTNPYTYQSTVCPKCLLKLEVKRDK